MINEYKEAQLFELKQNEAYDPKGDISLDFHSLKKKQNLKFVRRGSNTSVTTQVTSKSKFKNNNSKGLIKLIKERVLTNKEKNVENIKSMFKIALLERVNLQTNFIAGNEQYASFERCLKGVSAKVTQWFKIN
jgi:hypothetical protein